MILKYRFNSFREDGCAQKAAYTRSQAQIVGGGVIGEEKLVVVVHEIACLH